MTCDLVSCVGNLIRRLALTIISLTAQERPCTRCIKRNIGHLCHDEPREPVKKSKTDPDSTNGEEESSKQEVAPSDSSINALDQHINAPDAGLNLAPAPLPQNRVANAAPIAQPAPVSAPQVPPLTGNNQSCRLHTPPGLCVHHTDTS